MKRKYSKKIKQKINSKNIIIHINKYSTTIEIVKKNGKIIFNDFIYIGNENIFYDLVLSFHTYYEDAKKVYNQYNNLLIQDNGTIKLPTLGAKDILRDIFISDIIKVIYARVEELLYLIKRIIKQNDYSKYFDKIIIKSDLHNIIGFKQLASIIFSTTNLSINQNDIKDKFNRINEESKYYYPPLLRKYKIQIGLGRKK